MGNDNLDNRDRNSIAAMKRQTPLAKYGALAGIVATTIGILSQVIPPVWAILVTDERMKMKQDIAACQGDLKALKRVVRDGLIVTQERLDSSDDEVHDMRWSMRLISSEIRLRHGNDVDVPISSAPSNRWAKLRLVTEETDERFEKAKRKRDDNESLVDVMRQRGAPLQVIDLGER